MYEYSLPSSDQISYIAESDSLNAFDDLPMLGCAGYHCPWSSLLSINVLVARYRQSETKYLPRLPSCTVPCCFCCNDLIYKFISNDLRESNDFLSANVRKSLIDSLVYIEPTGGVRYPEYQEIHKFYDDDYDHTDGPDFPRNINQLTKHHRSVEGWLVSVYESIYHAYQRKCFKKNIKSLIKFIREHTEEIFVTREYASTDNLIEANKVMDEIGSHYDELDYRYYEMCDELEEMHYTMNQSVSKFYLLNLNNH